MDDAQKDMIRAMAKNREKQLEPIAYYLCSIVGDEICSPVCSCKTNKTTPCKLMLKHALHITKLMIDK